MFVSMLTKPETNDAHRWTATLDGVDVSNDCVEADDERGYVILLVMGADGRPVVANPGDLDSDWMHELRRGVVVLTKGERIPGR